MDVVELEPVARWIAGRFLVRARKTDGEDEGYVAQAGFHVFEEPQARSAVIGAAEAKVG